MNYELFQSYQKAFYFDEVKIIGKDVCLDGEWIHVVGMGRKAEGAFLYILEQQPSLEENPVWTPDRTNRERLLGTLGEYDGKALHVNKIRIGQDDFELQGGSCGNLAQREFAESYFFFQQMMENGWGISEDSCFYQLGWNCMGLAELRVKDSNEELPELSGEIAQLTIGHTSKRHIVQMPVKLERGKTNQLQISLENGETATCYINKVGMMEPLAEEREGFADVAYQEKMLQHVTREQFEEIKKKTLSMIEADCPEGMGYFTVEYECTKERFSAQIYAAEDLEQIPEPTVGSAAVFMVNRKPEQETGPHGLRSRCAVIQYAVPAGTKSLDAELVMMLEMVPEKQYHL